VGPEDAGEGGVARHVADEANARGVEAGLHGDLRLLGTGEHGLEAHVLPEHIAAAPVDIAHRCAHLLVGVGVDVLLQEVEQAAFLLQERQQLHGGLVAIA
jgi:hypothetical protein